MLLNLDKLQQIFKLEQGRKIKILSYNILSDKLIGFYSGETLQINENGDIQQVLDLNYLDYTCTETLDDELDQEEYLLNEKAQQCIENKQKYQERTAFSQQKKAKQARDKYSNIFQIKICNPYLYTQFQQTIALQDKDGFLLSGSDLGYIMQQSAINTTDKSVFIWDEYQGILIANAAQRMFIQQDRDEYYLVSKNHQEKIKELCEEVQKLLDYQDQEMTIGGKTKIVKMMICKQENYQNILDLQEKIKQLFQEMFEYYRNNYQSSLVYTGISQLHARNIFADCNVDWNQSNCISIQPERFNTRSMEQLMHMYRIVNKQQNQEKEPEIKRKITDENTYKKEIKFQQSLAFETKIVQQIPEVDQLFKIMKSSLVKFNENEYKILTPARGEIYDVIQNIVKDYDIKMPEKLIIATKARPLLIMQSILHNIVSGSPFVIFHPYIEYLNEVSEFLQQNKLGIKIKVQELREQKWQILPNRTHPDMMSQIANGYILTGFIVSP